MAYDDTLKDFAVVSNQDLGVSRVALYKSIRAENTLRTSTAVAKGIGLEEQTQKKTEVIDAPVL